MNLLSKIIKISLNARTNVRFTLFAISSLALGISVNLTLFSFANALLFRPLPLNSPDTLFQLGTQPRSYWFYKQFLDSTKGFFVDVTATTKPVKGTIDLGDRSFNANIELITGSYFRTLLLSTSQGRLISIDDDRIGHARPVVVISNHFWHTYYGASTDVIGQTLRVNRVPYTIIGIAPPSFFGIVVGEHSDIWIPLTTYPLLYPNKQYLDNKNANILTIVMKHSSTNSLQDLQRRYRSIYVNLEVERSGLPRQMDLIKLIESETPQLLPLKYGISYLRQHYEAPIRLLQFIAALGLLLACGNVSILTLIQSNIQWRDTNIRLALGAPPASIIISTITRSFAISVVATIIGIGLGKIVSFLLLLEAMPSGIYLDLSFDRNDYIFAFSIALLVAVLSSILPTVITRKSVQSYSSIVTGTYFGSPTTRLLGRCLAIIQISLSSFILTIAALFCGGLYILLHKDVGFNYKDLIVIDTELDTPINTNDDLRREYSQLCRRLISLPGVLSASFSENGLYSGRYSDTDIRLYGFQPKDPSGLHVRFDYVGHSYFTTMQAQLMSGRDISDRDILTSNPVALVNETFAHFYFNNRNPLGQLIYVPDNKSYKQIEIIGVVKDLFSEDPRRPATRYFFVSTPLHTTTGARILLRVDGTKHIAENTLRKFLLNESPILSIYSIEYAHKLLIQVTNDERLTAIVSALFALLALSISAIGIYSVFSLEIDRRHTEFAIRSALGALPRTLFYMLLKEVTITWLVGVTIGCSLAIMVFLLFRSMFHYLFSNEFVIIAAVILVTLTVSICSGILPARRIATVDMYSILRQN